jgi:hypothetical protein
VEGTANGPKGFGVRGFSNAADGIGVHGNTAFGAGTGVWGNTSTGVGVLGTNQGGSGLAGKFTGDVEIVGRLNLNGNCNVTGTITHDGELRCTKTMQAFDFVVAGGDCAEAFEVASGETFAPGSVMVFDDRGALRECHHDYDRRVAGVISGAGTYHPGILLGLASSNLNRQPIALAGKVFCKVDANRSPIEVGDLLTTSELAGYAMKAVDPARAFGAVIGKAIGALASGRGLLPILVALQ